MLIQQIRKGGEGAHPGQLNSELLWTAQSTKWRASVRQSNSQSNCFELQGMGGTPARQCFKFLATSVTETKGLSRPTFCLSFCDRNQRP